MKRCKIAAVMMTDGGFFVVFMRFEHKRYAILIFHFI
jgi:hypothetical protein